MSAVMHVPVRRDGASNRVLIVALLGSVLVHGLLLVCLSITREEAEAPVDPEPLVARLEEPASKPVIAQPEPPKPQAPPVPAAKPAPAPVPRAARVPDLRPPEKKAPPAKVAPSPSRIPMPASPPTAKPGTPEPSAPAPSAPDPSAASSAPDSPALESYRAQLVAVALRFKRYPRVALDNNWEGRSVVRLAIDADGTIASIGISNSAGHRVLDRQAMDMIRKAKGAVAIPRALQGRQFALEIPVIFDLKDQGAR